MLTDGLEWCGLLWCFYQLFGLSFWRHPFTAEHPLLRHWWNAKFLQIWWRNKLIYILNGLRGRTFVSSFHFVWTIPLITKEIWHVTIHPSDLVCVRWSPLGAAGVSATLCAGVHQLLLFGRRASAHGLLFLLTFTTTTEVLHMNIHQWISTFVTP